MREPGRLKVKSLKVEKARIGGCPPTRVFCKRVRKLLIVKGMREYSFLKSAEEIEKEGFNF